ncbi:MAG: hypothetical protein KBS60_00850, partial [Phascolarctobacterium sp.]|nr:hypothetical protein [Candidatus Phascolarctobacterium caballi]
MKINLKNKIMLAVLAGGMLCANGAMAAGCWYGASDNATTWNGAADVFDIPETACTTGADLTLDGAGTYGGIAFADVDKFIGGIDMGDGNVTQNLITVTGGVFAANRFIACGNTYLGDVTNNSIIILDGNFGENNTFEAGFSNVGTVSSNAVTISDGDFGASNKFYGGFNYSGDVTGNTVTISGGTFGNSNKFYGGFRYEGDVTGNTVTISGGDFGANVEIYGGMIEDGYTGDAINNTVEISGGDFSDGYKLYGGWCCLGTGSGNTLNLKTKMSGKASHVALFQIMNFTLPSDIANGDTMLKTQLLEVSDSDNTATVNVDAANGVSLKKGDVITLIDSDETYEHYAAGDILGGAAEFYSEADTGEDKNGDGDQYDLVITLLEDYSSGGGGDDQQKAPVEGIAAGVAMVNQSADLASGEGMQNLLKNTGNFDKTETNYNIDTFGAVTGSR